MLDYDLRLCLGPDAGPDIFALLHEAELLPLPGTHCLSPFWSPALLARS